MSLSAVSTNRNYINCCDDIRPFIVSVETTTVAATGAAATVTADVDIGDIDELTLQTLIANEITASSITTFNVVSLSGEPGQVSSGTTQRPIILP